MISKELLSEVLGLEIKEIKNKSNGALYVTDNCVGFSTKEETAGLINIYELAHKCKGWLNKIGYCYDISSTTNGLDIRVIIWNTQIKEYFHENTEHEAILKACEWIMEQTK